ncbi:hypothetical protein XA68_11924 [Ophiocordyceps unilateralis]|uniref:Septin-type G domain-containing protein n=1 Tax=Ophiocordyceps unilateralis TaxID=268505 RepID=A0A2A9PFS2_OPHUN|nr:hypothetical protein XA68_11924 [Ophiocordyceps unilateralis]
MRPVSISADSETARPDALPSHAPVAPLSCFITTEANLDSAAACPDVDCPPKHRSHQSPCGHSCSFSDHSVHRRRTISQASSDMAFEISPAPVSAGVVGSRSVASGLSSLGISPVSSSSGEPSGDSAKPAGLASGDLNATMAEGSFHQLVMPSLMVPRRRSFTDVGKSLGYLKLLVSGPAGIGKTSLIRSLGQNCQHIVYLDPISSFSTERVTEIFASTRSYPWWRAETRTIRRTKFVADELLERNICFADCPPFKSDTGQVTGYVESQLMQLCQKPIGDVDLFHLLSGGAGSIVHAVLYMLPNTGPRPEDIKHIKMLQEMTNVIPLLARADELTDEQAVFSKRRLLSLLARENLDLFSFTGTDSAQQESSIYAVSCTAQSDCTASEQEMHMSFEHIHPQAPTDLADLVDHIFSQDGSSWLRHSAAVKSVHWRRRQLEMASRSALTLRNITYSGTMTSPCLPFSEAPHRERIVFSSWAESLRQSLTAERICRSCSNLPSEVQRIELAMTQTGKSLNVARVQKSVERTSKVHQDPLGLLKLASQINHGGRLSLELLTSLGGFGVAAWLVRPELARQCGMGLSTSWGLATS